MKIPSPAKVLLFFGFEILRLCFIFTFRPEYDIDVLPASWYMAAPLLILPLLLALFVYKVPTEEKTVYRKIYAYSKFLSIAGFFPYIKAAVIPALENAQLTNYYSLKHMGILLIFLVIDVILSLVFLLDRDEETKQDEGEEIHADNPSSQW